MNDWPGGFPPTAQQAAEPPGRRRREHQDTVAHAGGSAPQVVWPGGLPPGSPPGGWPVTKPEVAKRTPLHKWRKTRYRFRQQMPPWYLWWLIPAATLFHTMNWPWMPIKLLVVIVVACVVGAIVAQRRKQLAANAHLYLQVCVGAATAWMLWSVRFGLWGTPGRFSFLGFLLLWLPLSYVWWDKHRTRSVHDKRPAAPAPTAPAEPVHPFTRAWREKVQPSLKWRISEPLEVMAGDAFTVRLVPGQTVEDAQQAVRKVASLLGGISRDRLLFETGPDEDEATILLTVLRKDNPQHEVQEWDGPTLDKTTGLYKHGVYPDADTFLRLFSTEPDGTPVRARNGLWSGKTGGGKSRGIALKILEQCLSRMFVTWYADGQDGASAPEVEEHVDWYAPNHDELLRLLRAAWKVMKARNVAIRQAHQAAFRGAKAILLGSAAFPFLQIILDEVQEFLKDPIVAKLVKALLRMGNKVGIGVDIITQVPLLAELGNATGDGGGEIIRSMAKSGNVVVYRVEDNFTSSVTMGDDESFAPTSLPNIPGACKVNDGLHRQAWSRTLLVTPQILWERLNGVPVLTLDAMSARAAGEDYATRHLRAQDNRVPAEEIDLEDLDAELAMMLGEATTTSAKPGGEEKALTIKNAILEIARAASGPLKREEFAAELAARGVKASKSTIDQTLAYWVKHDHLVKPAHGVYDLASREDQELAPTP